MWPGAPDISRLSSRICASSSSRRGNLGCVSLLKPRVALSSAPLMSFCMYCERDRKNHILAPCRGFRSSAFPSTGSPPTSAAFGSQFPIVPHTRPRFWNRPGWHSANDNPCCISRACETNPASETRISQAKAALPGFIVMVGEFDMPVSVRPPQVCPPSAKRKAPSGSG